MLISTLIPKLRIIIHDPLKDTNDVYIYSNNKNFTLSENNVSSITEVAINDVSSGINYSFNSSRNRITVNSSLITDDVVEISYKAYLYYGDSELTDYLKLAMIKLNALKYKTFSFDDTTVYPDLDWSEQNLICLIAGMLISPEDVSYKLPDITVTSSSKLSVDDKIEKLISQFKKDKIGDYIIGIYNLHNYDRTYYV